MVVVGKSRAVCGVCGKEMEVEWDLEWVKSYEKEQGLENYYESAVELECEQCGAHMTAKLTAWEYPEGTLETCEAVMEGDATGKSMVEEPEIDFYDL